MDTVLPSVANSPFPSNDSFLKFGSSPAPRSLCTVAALQNLNIERTGMSDRKLVSPEILRVYHHGIHISDTKTDLLHAFSSTFRFGVDTPPNEDYLIQEAFHIPNRWIFQYCFSDCCHYSLLFICFFSIFIGRPFLGISFHDIHCIRIVNYRDGISFCFSPLFERFKFRPLADKNKVFFQCCCFLLVLDRMFRCNRTMLDVTAL